MDVDLDMNHGVEMPLSVRAKADTRRSAVAPLIHDRHEAGLPLRQKRVRSRAMATRRPVVDRGGWTSSVVDDPLVRAIIGSRQCFRSATRASDRQPQPRNLIGTQPQLASLSITDVTVIAMVAGMNKRVGVTGR